MVDSSSMEFVNNWTNGWPSWQYILKLNIETGVHFETWSTVCLPTPCDPTVFTNFSDTYDKGNSCPLLLGLNSQFQKFVYNKALVSQWLAQVNLRSHIHVLFGKWPMADCYFWPCNSLYTLHLWTQGMHTIYRDKTKYIFSCFALCVEVAHLCKFKRY